MRFILAILALSLLAGCPGTSIPVDRRPVSDQTDTTAKELSYARVALLDGPSSVKGYVGSLTVENLPVVKGQATVKIEEVATHLEAATTQNASATVGAKADEKKIAEQTTTIAKLKESNPIKTWLEIIGLAAIVGGVGVLIASIFVNALQALAWLRSAAVGAVAFGLCLVSIAWFLTAIMWIVFGCIAAAIIFALIWVLTHKTIRDAIAADVDGWFKVTPKQVMEIPGLAAALGVMVQTTSKVVPTPTPKVVP